MNSRCLAPGAFYLRAYNPGYGRDTATSGGVTTGYGVRLRHNF